MGQVEVDEFEYDMLTYVIMTEDRSLSFADAQKLALTEIREIREEER